MDSSSDDTREAPNIVSVKSPRVRFDTRDMLRRWWAVLSKPGVATFDIQQEGASWSSVVIQLAILGVLDALLASLGTTTGVILVIVGSIASAYISFFLLAGLTYGSARLFGGNGAFLPLAYTLVLIYVPLQILGIAVLFVPGIGPLLQLALFIYQILLSVYAVASVYKLKMMRAAGAALVPILALFVLGYVLVALGLQSVAGL
ncbi:MAG: YIP1 family protein [Ktedonobacterales bacterium]